MDKNFQLKSVNMNKLTGSKNGVRLNQTPEKNKMRSQMNEPKKKVNHEREINMNQPLDIHKRAKSNSTEFSQPRGKLNAVPLQPILLQKKQGNISTNNSIKHDYSSKAEIDQRNNTIDKKKSYDNSSENNLPNIRTVNNIRKQVSTGHKQSKSVDINNLLDYDKNSIVNKYKYLIRSPNIPQERVTNFLLQVIRGLHYSTQCQKPPSKKFISTRNFSFFFS